MRRLRKSMLCALLAAFILAGAGCAAAPVAFMPIAAQGVAGAASGGISYTFTNIATRTTNRPMDEVAEATLKALRKMGIEVLSKKKNGDEIYIRARTSRLYIYINVVYMTPVLTRLKVNAKKGLFFKDKETAFEIVLLAERYLQGAEPPAPELSGNRRGTHPTGGGSS